MARAQKALVQAQGLLKEQEYSDNETGLSNKTYSRACRLPLAQTVRMRTLNPLI